MAAGYVQNLTSVNLHIYGYVSLEISEFIFFEITMICFCLQKICRLLKLREVTCEIMANNSQLVVSLR